MFQAPIAGQQLLLLLVGDRQVHYPLHGLSNNHSIAAGQSNVSVGQLLDVANQVSVQHDGSPI